MLRKMQPQLQDIIKEIDPDYHSCYYCRRVFHVSILSHRHDTYICRDQEGCSKHQDWLLGEILDRYKRNHQRTRP